MYIYVFFFNLKCLENVQKINSTCLFISHQTISTHLCHFNLFISISLTTKKRYGILLYCLYMINRSTDKRFPLWTNNADKNICHRNDYYLPTDYYLCLVHAYDYKVAQKCFQNTLILKRSVKITILQTYSYFSH